MRREPNRAGTALIEVVVCIAVLSVLLPIIGDNYVCMLRYVGKEHRQVQLLVDVQQVQRFIVQDVQQAIALPEKYGAYEANESTLLCRVPSAGTGEEGLAGSQVVIYTAGGENGTSLVRRIIHGGERGRPHVEKVLLKDLESFAFERLPESWGGMVRCRITVFENGIYTGKPTVYAFVAGRRNE